MSQSQIPATKPISKIREFYEKRYKFLMTITIIIIFLALISVTYKYLKTGELFNKDISLKGGLSLTILTKKQLDIQSISHGISTELKGKQINIREIVTAGKQNGIIIDVDIDGNNKTELDNLIKSVEKSVGFSIEGDYSIEFIGSTLGKSFFKETMIAIFIAFLSMAVVVTIYFRMPIPSLAVIAAAFGDIVVTLAIINILGMRIGSAGIAAFLMLIGYSVDTDMLLTTRVLKRKEGTVSDRIIDSVKTGMKMTLTTIFAVLVSLFLAKSSVIKEIMIIIFIGMIIDMATTWFMNVGILRLYLEHKKPT